MLAGLVASDEREANRYFSHEILLRMLKDLSRAAWSKICAVTMSSSGLWRAIKSFRPCPTLAGEPTMAQAAV